MTAIWDWTGFPSRRYAGAGCERAPIPVNREIFETGAIMHSRVSLSLLAFVCGAAVLYVVEFYGLVSVPKYEADIGTTVIVAFGGLCTVVGWIRIFRRRPQGPSDASSGPADGA